MFAGAPQSGPDDLHSIVDSNGMPTKYPLYTPTGTVKDSSLTVKCGGGEPAGTPCGDYAVNTTQPFFKPYSPGTPDVRRLPPLTTPNIGDELSAKGIDWAWYAGGWSNADGDVGAPGWTNGTGPACFDPNANPGLGFPNCPDKLFQYHHQPFAYYADLAPGTAARAQHLRDEAEFIAAAESSRSACDLKPVSFVKPIGEENEHPGYTGEHGGNQHAVDLLQAIMSGKCAKDTLVILTYDEFGGSWEHVASTRPGRHDSGPVRPVGAGDACSGAARLEPAAQGLRRRPHVARHDLDPRDDRASLRPRAALGA